MEGDFCGDKRLDTNRAAAEEFQTGRVFTLGSAGAVEGEFACNDGLKGKVNLRRNVSDESERAAFAKALDGKLDGHGGTNGFDGHVCAASTSKFGDVIWSIWVSGIESFVGTQLACKGEFLGLDVKRYEASAAGKSQGLDDQESNHSGSDHHGRISKADGDAVDGMDGNGDGLNHGRVVEGEFVREANGGSFGDDDVFGKGAVAAVFSAGDSQDAAVVAEVYLPGSAEGAFAAIDGGIEGYAVAGAEVFDGRADGFDNSCGFMAHDEGRYASAGTSVVSVDVTSANAAGPDSDEQFIGRRGRRWKISNLEPAIFRQ